MNRMQRNTPLDLHRQQGAILLVGLVVLLLMTIIGVAVMDGNAMGERMAGNYRERQIAFQAAEAALREGERLVLATNGWQGLVADDCTNGYCTARKLDAAYAASIGIDDCANANNLEDRWVDIAGCTGSLNVWSNAARHRVYSNTVINEVSTQARYIVELVGNFIEPPNDITTCPDPLVADICPDVFRVTALGTGGAIRKPL